MADDLVSEQRRRIDEAVELVAAAQREVDRAVSDLSGDTPRAQKTIIGKVLRDALDKLSLAREKLEQARADPPA
jgi:hypothetical protein